MDQIKFLDQFVKHCGINDYKTQITTSQLQLARKNYIIDTIIMTFYLLKGLLKTNLYQL